MVGGKYKEIKVSTKESRKLSFSKLQWVCIKQQNCRGTDRSLQTCLKNAAEKKKLVLSISQLPALLVLVFFSAAFSAVMQQTLWNKKWNQSKHQLTPRV